MTACPVEGCARLRQGEMCKVHWYQVPQNLRAQVWRTWRAWNKDMDDVDAMHAYRIASEAALAQVKP